MPINVKQLTEALSAVEDETRISEDIIIDALKDAYGKAYKKTMGLDDINVEVEFNPKKGTFDIYQIYNVVEDVQDDELEMDLEEARKWKRDAILNDQVRRKVDVNVDDMTRAAVSLAHNVLRQKIREAEKDAIYNAYIDQLYDMTIGIVESVKSTFALINLGKTTALLPKAAQIPGERLVEGQRIRVVITEVNKDSKSSQVVVSRGDPMLVKRLFEKEVPEIAQGIVEIKAIARDPGDRTKMAVVSYNPEVDPIGACIGQRGQRVQQIIEELHGEKIDIFEWSEDVSVLVKNALAPAEIKEVLPGEDDKSLIVVVDEDQLSLAIGKKGKNARLAVKLTGRKIDIKTKAELIANGVDYDALVELAAKKRAELAAAKAKRQAEKKAEDTAVLSEEEQKAQAKLAAAREQAKQALEAAGDELIPEEMQETLSDRARDEVFSSEEPADAAKKDETAEAAAQETPAEAEDVKEAAEPEVNEEAVEQEDAAASEETEEEETSQPVMNEEEQKTKAASKKRKVDLEEMAQKNDYVSVFEKLADTSKPHGDTRPKKKYSKRKSEDEGVKLTNAELMKQLAEKNKSLQDNSVKPVYTEEELAEIEAQQEADEESQYDIDYDEYEDYYKDDETK